LFQLLPLRDTSLRSMKSERQTRQEGIDLQLGRAGWALDSRRLIEEFLVATTTSVLREQKGVYRATNEFADYALVDRLGRVLAIVEATRAAPQPLVSLVAIDPENQTRLDNLDQMFGLNEFWGRYLDDEVQSVAGDVDGWLKADGQPASEANVKAYVLRRAEQERNRRGRDGLAIVKSFFYQHIADTPVLLAQVVRTCTQGT
jgi:hypothetical protein